MTGGARRPGRQTHLFLADPGTEEFLLAEIGRIAPGARHERAGDGLVTSGIPLDPAAPPVIAFARQTLVDAAAGEAPSIQAWSRLVADTAAAALPEAGSWRLHVAPRYGEGRAGTRRAALIAGAIAEHLSKRRRRLLRALEPGSAPFTPETSLVQLVLSSPDQGWLSVAAAPLPYALRRIISPFPLGEVRVPRDPAPPSRAYAKLIEAEERLGRRIAAGETCVDLGAAPGSWSHVALARGARVIAVDRSGLRDDLMASPRLEFRRGDAFRFEPESPVDWLLCDVIAAPERSIALLIDWVRRRLARRFVVTIKFTGQERYAELDELARILPAECAELYITKLSANKNEVTAFGEVRA